MMTDKKYSYIVGIALVVLLVLIVYLAGRIRQLEDGVLDLYDRVDLLEISLGGEGAAADLLPLEDLTQEELDALLEEEIQAYVDDFGYDEDLASVLEAYDEYLYGDELYYDYEY